MPRGTRRYHGSRRYCGLRAAPRSTRGFHPSRTRRIRSAWSISPTGGIPVNPHWFGSCMQWDGRHRDRASAHHRHLRRRKVDTLSVGGLLVSPALSRFSEIIASIHSPQFTHRQAGTTNSRARSTSRDPVKLWTMKPWHREQTPCSTRLFLSGELCGVTTGASRCRIVVDGSLLRG
jgi:hypothetical protein